MPYEIVWNRDGSRPHPFVDWDEDGTVCAVVSCASDAVAGFGMAPNHPIHRVGPITRLRFWIRDRFVARREIRWR